MLRGQPFLLRQRRTKAARLRTLHLPFKNSLYAPEAFRVPGQRLQHPSLLETHTRHPASATCDQHETMGTAACDMSSCTGLPDAEIHGPFQQDETCQRSAIGEQKLKPGSTYRIR